MANDRDITIRISADGTAAIAGIRSVGDETGKLGSRTTSFLEQAKQNWVAYTAVLYAAARAAEGAWNLVNEAMKVEAQLAMLDRLTAKYETSGAEIAAALQSASNSTISRADAVQVAVKGIYAGLDPTQLTKLMTITSAAALANGITVAEAYEKIAQAAETGRTRSIKQMGIIVDLAKAQEDYAARLNTTTKELTEQEKMTASVNAILASQGRIMAELGGPTDTLRTQTMQLSAAWKDLKENVGGVLAQLAGLALRGFNAVSTSFGESLAQLDKTGGASGSWGNGPPAPAGPDIREWSERQAKLAAIMGKILEEQNLADAAEKDKELVRLNLWFDQQVKKLHDLGASNKEYSELVVAYAAKRHADLSAWATKTSDFYLEVQRANVKENDEIEKARNAALFKTAEDGVKERLAMQDAYAKAWNSETESDAIRRKAEGEREILDIRQAGLIASITEQTTFAETLKIMEEYAVLQNQIEASKRVEVTDLDVRQLAIKREMLQLQMKSADLALKAGGQNAGSIPGMQDFFTSMNSFVEASSNLTSGTGPWEAWAKSAEAAYDRVAESYRNGLATMDEEDKAFKDAVAAREEADWMMRVQIAGAAMGMMANMATSLYMLQGQQGGAAFEAMKAFRIGETLMNTYSAAVGAYNALASIPYVGPALGAAAAAAAIAFGMAQVDAISSMQPGGGATSASTAGLAGGSASSTSAPAPVTQQAPASPVINIYLSGMWGDVNAAAREIAPAITKAYLDGVR